MCMYIIGGVFLLSIRGRNRGSKQASNEGRKEGRNEEVGIVNRMCVSIYSLSCNIYIYVYAQLQILCTAQLAGHVFVSPDFGALFLT